jgi:hypothetical protein
MTESSKDRIFSLTLSAYVAKERVGLYVDTNSGPYCAVQIGKIGEDL